MFLYNSLKNLCPKPNLQLGEGGGGGGEPLKPNKI